MSDMSDAKTYVFGNDGNNATLSMLAGMLNKGCDPMSMMAAMNNSGFGGNCWWIIILFLAICGTNGWNGGSQAGTERILETLNGDTGREMLNSAIQGNANAIAQLSTTMGCSFQTIQTAINTINTGICNLGNQMNMNSQQIITEICSGKFALAQQLASCCCDIRESVTKMGYENQIANLNQTNQLMSQLNFNNNSVERGFSQVGNAMFQQTCSLQNTINSGIQRVIDGQCAAEKREMQAIINKQNEELSTYKSGAMTQDIVGKAMAPVNAALSTLASKIAEIECKQPNTVNVPYQPFTAIPNCVAWQNGLYGFNNFNNPQWI